MKKVQDVLESKASCDKAGEESSYMFRERATKNLSAIEAVIAAAAILENIMIQSEISYSIFGMATIQDSMHKYCR